MDSEDYSLWAAFMEPDSPPSSPCHGPSSADGSDADGKEARDDREADDDGEGVWFWGLVLCLCWLVGLRSRRLIDFVCVCVCAFCCWSMR